MTTSHSNLELSSLSSNSSQLPKQKQAQNSILDESHLPDEEDQPLQKSQIISEELQEALDLDLEPQETSNKGSYKNKSHYITRRMFEYLCLIGLILALGSRFYFWMPKAHIKKLQGPISKPLNFMSANLKADPIMDIQILTKKATCREGFEPLKLGTWSGTVAGCLCENGDLFASSCKEVNAEKCKKDIPRTDPIEMNEWDGSIWCVKRAVQGTDYHKKAECPTSFKECYPGGCFAEDCPITKIEMTPEEETKQRKGGLTLSKKEGELPIINIQMTFGEIPCFTQDLFAQPIKNFTYHLSAVKQISCDKYGFNHRFTAKVDSHTAYDSFTQNSFPESVMNLPYFAGNAHVTRSILSSLVRMNTTKHDHCLDIDGKSIKNFIEFWDSWESVILVLVLLTFFFFDSWFIAIGGIDDNRVLSRAHALSARIKFFYNSAVLIRINLGLSLIMTPLLVWFHSNAHERFMIMKEYFEGYSSLGCFEGGQGSIVISDYLKIIEKIEENLWIYWVLLIASILSNVKYIWLFIAKKMISK